MHSDPVGGAAARGQQLVVATFAAAQPQDAVGQDAAFEEGAELVLHEAGRLGPGVGFGVGSEAGRVLLHQAIQRCFFRAMAFAVDRGTILRPMGLPADGLHAWPPSW